VPDIVVTEAIAIGGEDFSFVSLRLNVVD